MTPHDQHVKKLLSTFFLEFLVAFLPAIARAVDRRRFEFLDKELARLLEAPQPRGGGVDGPDAPRAG